MSRIKYFVMDVDGTLTDGKIYMGQNEELIKAFDAKDGCGILMVLPQYNIQPIIITARKSKILENRCKELGIVELHQSVSDKLLKLKEIVGDSFDSVVYAGDDLPDIPCMMEVKRSGGIVVCPSNAIPEVKALSNYVSGLKAGNGAIRDCINYTVRCVRNFDVSRRINYIIDSILSGNYDKQQSGLFDDGSKYTIQEYTTRPEAECMIETHRRNIDIHYILEGCEILKIYSNECLTDLGVYKDDTDCEYWQDGIEVSSLMLKPGSIIVIHNNRPHKGAIMYKRSEKVRKLVCKIKI